MVGSAGPIRGMLCSPRQLYTYPREWSPLCLLMARCHKRSQRCVQWENQDEVLNSGVNMIGRVSTESLTTNAPSLRLPPIVRGAPALGKRSSLKMGEVTTYDAGLLQNFPQTSRKTSFNLIHG